MSIHWVVTAFDWPNETEADLFAVCKVLNEPDFAPLMALHRIMIALKLGRHYKGEFRLPRAGQALAGHPGRIFGTIVPFFLFRFDQASLSRVDDTPALGDWEVFLNVLNVETEGGATGAHLRRLLFGEPEAGPSPGYDGTMSQLYIHGLRPLCWAGLLQQAHGTGSSQFDKALFTKTPLWTAALRLETDGMVPAARRP